MKVQADGDGLEVPASLTGSYDVLFDGEAVWSFNARAAGRLDRTQRVTWPDAMRPFLSGTAAITLRGPDGALEDAGEVRFDESPDRVSFVDKRGLPVVIDKWGIVQRPFSTRASTVLDDLASRTREVIDILRADCGIETWMSFGTLLGAARGGKAIGHDSDVDLLYLSEHRSPAEINLESYRIKRALTRHGLRVVVKTGSFVTVVFEASDGAPLGIDVYACFYVGDLLHETATVRAPIPREAVLPLQTLEFEGVRLPAPADPDALLTASYGPDWRVPDPSFRHRPGPEITQRFDGWFGSAMTHRRAWELWWFQHPEPGPVSPLAERVRDESPSGSRVLDLGAGTGGDALALAGAGRRVLALDYARGCFRTATARAKQADLPLRYRPVNFYDLRDAVTLAALLRHTAGGARTLLLNGLLDSLQPHGADNLWRFVEMMVRGGRSRVFLGFDEPVDLGSPPGSFAEGGTPRYAVDAEQVRARIAALGGTVTSADVVAEHPADEDAAARRSWQVVARWR